MPTRRCTRPSRTAATGSRCGAAGDDGSAQCPRAEVSERKLKGYLLSDQHPAGRHKAAFFRRFGFADKDWRTLRRALLAHAAKGRVAAEVETAFGRKYIVVGELDTPDGRRPRVGSVWFIGREDDVPRLVTAYPVAGDAR